MEPEKLFAALVQVSQDQQKTLTELLGQLERQVHSLDATQQKTQRAASALQQAVEATAPYLQQAVRDGVEGAVQPTLQAASERVEQRLERAGQPLLSRLAEVTTATEVVENRLQRAAQAFGWKWGLLVSGIAIVAMVVVSAVTAGAVAWQWRELRQLNTAIAQSEARLQVLEQRGGKIELADCGGRLCAYASTNQGEGFKDWKGPWQGKHDLPAVILRGY
jgi:hypothetical protein